MEILTFLGLTIAFWLLLRWVFAWWRDRMLEKLATEIVKNNLLIPVRVEQHDGVFYLYNVHDDSFIAQGLTVDELHTKVKSRWPDAQVFVTQGDQDAIQNLKATV